MLLCLAIIAAYSGTLAVPFIFDDSGAILENHSIRDLGSLEVLRPAPDATGAAGRPIVNLSLAVNYAIGGMDVRGYHIFNIVLHICVAHLLWAIVQQMIMFRRKRAEAIGKLDAAPSAWCVFLPALVWSVHPLLTESVTCVVQRSELIGSFFYLATIFLYFNSALYPANKIWPILTFISCLAGVFSKEFIATVPVVVWLADILCISGSLRGSWHMRRRLLLSLFATWLPLAWVIGGNAQRGGSVGFGLGVTAWQYAVTQCEAIGMYLKLSLLPHPLVLDYGTYLSGSAVKVIPQFIVIVGLMVCAYRLWRSRPEFTLAIVAFFAILAPSSSFVPLVTQTMAEHRMYLPLATLACAAACCIPARRLRLVSMICPLLVLCYIGMTVTRNKQYLSENGIWLDTVKKMPDNARAHINLGSTFVDLGENELALFHYRRGSELDASDPVVNMNLALTLRKMNELQASLEQAELAVAKGPESAGGYLQRGATQLALKAYDDAMRSYGTARQIEGERTPPEVYKGIGTALLGLGRAQEAVRYLKKAVELGPDYAESHFALASALQRAGQPAAAAASFLNGSFLRDVDPSELEEWCVALDSAGRTEVAKRYRAQLGAKRQRLDSKEQARIQLQYGDALVRLGDTAGALERYQQALKYHPEWVIALEKIAEQLLLQNRAPEAIRYLEEAVRLQPNDAALHEKLKIARRSTNVT